MSSEPNDITNGAGSGDGGKHVLLRELDDIMQPEDNPKAADISFEKDSAEGLAHLNSEKIPAIIDQLNRNLRTQVKKSRRTKNRLPGQSFGYITVMTVLLLLVLAYIVIRKMH